MEYQVVQAATGDMYILNYLDFKSMQKLHKQLKQSYKNINWKHVKICGWNSDIYYGYILCK